MSKIIELLAELDIAVRLIVSDEERYMTDLDYVRGMPVADMVMSTKDMERIARATSGLMDKVIETMLQSVVDMKPFDMPGAASVALAALCLRLNEAIAHFEIANLEVLAAHASIESQRRGMSLAEVKQECHRTEDRIINDILNNLFGGGAPKPRGHTTAEQAAAEDEELRRLKKELGR